jgi:hypothetical protein
MRLLVMTFDMDMSTEEESAESGSVQEKDQISRGGLDKRALLKVQRTGGSKKLKTPVKLSLKDAITSMFQEEAEEGSDEVKMDVELDSNPAVHKLAPEHLTGSLEETCQEK